MRKSQASSRFDGGKRAAIDAASSDAAHSRIAADIVPGTHSGALAVSSGVGTSNPLSVMEIMQYRPIR